MDPLASIRVVVKPVDGSTCVVTGVCLGKVASHIVVFEVGEIVEEPVVCPVVEAKVGTKIESNSCGSVEHCCYSVGASMKCVARCSEGRGGYYVDNIHTE